MGNQNRIRIRLHKTATGVVQIRSETFMKFGVNVLGTWGMKSCWQEEYSFVVQAVEAAAMKVLHGRSVEATTVTMLA